MSRRMLFRAKCRHIFNQECMKQYMSTAGDMTPDCPVCHNDLTIGIEAPALELEANFNILLRDKESLGNSISRLGGLPPRSRHLSRNFLIFACKTKSHKRRIFQCAWIREYY
ncbi:hypothetical protein EV702DRAFT_105528 [Suillus placidus]|uniref:RING-type domain-containing protein n=1 Tax=Suillus placidus TaxID=48579 RepID=A0A9P6ZI51_9AGAM|nr:hypothetical protein EV702DRAFT_105528 [Suillus placidus]